MASSLPQLTRFRSRLVDRPLGVGPPFWAEIDGYDPSAQIHRATLRDSGRHREFADLIAQLSAGSRRQREMLWEAWSIDGLPGGRWALVVRLSPVLSESAPSVWSRLLHSDPRHDGSDDQARQPSPAIPAVSELAADVIAELVEFQFKGLYLVAGTVTGLVRALQRQLGGTPAGTQRDSAPTARGPFPRNAFNAPLTGRRAVAFASVWRVRRRRHQCVPGRVHAVTASVAATPRHCARRSPGDVDAVHAVRRCPWRR